MVEVTKDGVSYIVAEEKVAEYVAKGYTEVKPAAKKAEKAVKK